MDQKGINKESNSTKKIKSRSTLFSCSIGRKLRWVHVYIAGPHPPSPGKNTLSFLNSPVVPAGVIFRKCFTKSSLFSDFAFKARSRISLFVSGSGLVKDAGSKCRVSWNWITISLTSLVERNEMDWMELLTFSGSASSFRVVPWKWYRNNWKNKELHWDDKLTMKESYLLTLNIMNW